MDFHVSTHKLARYGERIIDGIRMDDRIFVECNGRPAAILTCIIPHLSYRGLPRISSATFRESVAHYLEAAPFIITSDGTPRALLMPYRHTPTDVVRIEFDMGDERQYASVLNMLSAHLPGLAEAGVHVRLHIRTTRNTERKSILTHLLHRPPSR